MRPVHAKICLALAALACPALLHAQQGGADVIAHWPLRGDARDRGPHKLPGVHHGVRFDASERDGAAAFDGRGAHLAVSLPESLRLGTDDFTIALWAHTEGSLDDDLGDLISQYDPARRVGFHLSLRTNSGVTSCQPNSRQLQFGVDAGSESVWTDEGRPGSAVFAFGLAVHDGKLYAGTCEAGEGEAGHVYRYEGPGQWTDLGSPDRSNAVSAMASHRGSLHIGTAKYRLAGSALPESANPHLGGRIYRLDADGAWTEVGALPECEAVGGMAVYRDRLYATSLYRPAGFFRYERDGEWTALPTPGGLRVEALGVFNGYLWASSYDGGHVFRFDGQSWTRLPPVGDNTQTYSFAIHQGRLLVGTWPSGRVYRLAENEAWEDLGRLGEELEVMGMTVHNGKLYAGTLPLAEVYRYDGGQLWTKVARLDQTPEVKYRRAWTMAQYQGRLFCSTLPSGRIHSMEAGKLLTYDHELPLGWRHLAAVRTGDRLRLYVDGRQVAESISPETSKFDLSPDAPLVLGGGSGDFFKGQMRDVRLYRRALSETELRRLASP